MVIQFKIFARKAQKQNSRGSFLRLPGAHPVEKRFIKTKEVIRHKRR